MQLTLALILNLTKFVLKNVLYSSAVPKITYFQRFCLESGPDESEKLIGRIGDPDQHFEYTTFVLAKMSPHRGSEPAM